MTPASAATALLAVLHEARRLLALPDNDFTWSSWPSADHALAEIDDLIASIASGSPPARVALDVLFAPTGPMQEVSLSSGWASAFLALATRADAALADAYAPRR